MAHSVQTEVSEVPLPHSVRGMSYSHGNLCWTLSSHKKPQKYRTERWHSATVKPLLKSMVYCQL